MTAQLIYLSARRLSVPQRLDGGAALQESIELSGDDDAESSDDEPDGKGEGSGLLRVGSLVAVPLAGGRRHGRVERICGGEQGAPAGGVTVRLLASGSSQATMREGLSAAGLRQLNEERSSSSPPCAARAGSRNPRASS
ncbi:unnamed protein product [Prorocentrum cordatum]|uniref:Uncharacterized protein n=1 Tax=Prorocentrum cordatum TaxID=2364126 RepID=A0ABN9Q8Z7_9DINO|nr:unnamed protein product [Polarella glacialis]